MAVANRIVAGVLRSPLHGLLSGKVDLLRYDGRRSGRTIETPTQYVLVGDDVVILVGRPDTKSWWRNFTEPRDLDVLIAGEWRPLRGEVRRGADDPDAVRPLLDAYLAKFPGARRSLGDDPVAGAVLVRCTPR
jgi:hypothetical protein